MRKFKWLVGGVVIGFIAAHYVNQTPEGQRFFGRISQGAREFNDAVYEGYRKGDAGATEVLDDVERALKTLRAKI